MSLFQVNSQFVTLNSKTGTYLSVETKLHVYIVTYLHVASNFLLSLSSGNPTNLLFCIALLKFQQELTKVKDVCTHMDIFLEEIRSRRICTILKIFKGY